MYLIQSARVVIHVLYVPLLTLTRCQIVTVVATTYFFQRLVRQSERIRMTNHMIMMHPVLIDSLSFIFPIYSSAIGASVLTHAVTCMPAKPSLTFRRECSELP